MMKYTPEIYKSICWI